MSKILKQNTCGNGNNRSSGLIVNKLYSNTF